MFARLDDRLDAEVTSLVAAGAGKGRDAALLNFFLWSRIHIDADIYAGIQSRCLDPGRQEPRFNPKYLDYVYWTSQKVRIAMSLGLDKPPVKRVLDIGAGVGHFSLVARSMGHDVTALDVPVDFAGHEYYDRLTRFFGVTKRVEHVIRAGEPLPHFAERFDAAVALKSQFNMLDGSPWGADEWRFLVADLQQNVLAPGGVFMLQVPERKLSSAAWVCLESIAEYSDRELRTVRIRNPAA